MRPHGAVLYQEIFNEMGGVKIKEEEPLPDVGHPRVAVEATWWHRHDVSALSFTEICEEIDKGLAAIDPTSDLVAILSQSFLTTAESKHWASPNWKPRCGMDMLDYGNFSAAVLVIYMGEKLRSFLHKNTMSRLYDRQIR